MSLIHYYSSLKDSVFKIIIYSIHLYMKLYEKNLWGQIKESESEGMNGIIDAIGF